MTLEDEELETGGMFYFDAFADGERVNLKKELTVDIPANPDKIGMELYDGIMNDADELRWTKPKPLIKPLIPTEITDLDFYPEGYEPKMEEWGYLNKAFKDSLYYSFATECFADDLEVGEDNVEVPDVHSVQEIPVDSKIGGEDINVPNIQRVQRSSVLPLGMFMPIPQDELDDAIEVIVDSACIDCGVNPASVKTIWNKKFNNTNLATYEFEERMSYIHQTCNNAILELYTSNLDMNLSEVDALAANRLGGSLRSKFQSFAAREDGKVEVSSAAQKHLNKYYKRKRLALQRAIELTNANYWQEQTRLNSQTIKKKAEATLNNEQANVELNKAELAFNTTRVYDDLGMKKPRRPVSNPVTFGNGSSRDYRMPVDMVMGAAAPLLRPIQSQRNILRANVNSLGWKNVDCLASATQGRLNAKIKGNGRTTEMSYSDMAVELESEQDYLAVNVYVVPKEINSYVKLKPVRGDYTYRLNDNLNYELIVIAWDAYSFYHYREDASKGKSIVELNKVSRDEWENQIKVNLASINQLGEEIDYLDYAKKDIERQNENSIKRGLKDKARPYVFPCECTASEVRIVEENFH